MSAECHPITVLPGTSRLFRDFTEMRSLPATSPVHAWYGGNPYAADWMKGFRRALEPPRISLADALLSQNVVWGAGPKVLANLDRLREGARAVVTGQQVGLFGGPVLTLHKAATAIRKAQMATDAGEPHVPIFWLASEDHDLPEVNQVSFPGKTGIETLRSQFADHRLRPVGGLPLCEAIEPLLARAEELLGFGSVAQLLRQSYTPLDTLASAFAKFIGGVFREHGLIVIDASTRVFHAMGAPVLRYAIEHADELHGVLLHRSAELEAAGYQAQVLVAEGASLLFLLDDQGNRVPLRRTSNSGEAGAWKAGPRSYTTEQLLQIVEAAPERLSPNALLRPVFQDAILPASAYVGGPAEIAYFAQCQPLYERILHGVTPVLPRLSATLIEPTVRAVMEQHEITLEAALQTTDELAQQLAARALPIAGKRAIASAGNALDAELIETTRWMQSMDAGLGRSAEVAASKMRYQMNRLRRLAANWQLQKETYLRKHAAAVTSSIFPECHLQERFLAGAWFLEHAQVDLPSLLVDSADQSCPGHRVLDI